MAWVVASGEHEVSISEEEEDEGEKEGGLSRQHSLILADGEDEECLNHEVDQEAGERRRLSLAPGAPHSGQLLFSHI